MDFDFTNAAPAAPYIKAGREPHLQGLRCHDCDAAYVKPHMACPTCGSRTPLSPFTAAGSGKVMTYTIVGRSYPGIPVPFVSTFVRLDDGLVLKGVLRGVDPHPDAIHVELPVKVVFDAAHGLATKDGVPYFSFFFEPLN